MVRDDDTDARLTMDNGHTKDFMTILGGAYSYTLHFKGEIPSEFWIFGLGIEKYELIS